MHGAAGGVVLQPRGLLRAAPPGQHQQPALHRSAQVNNRYYLHRRGHFYWYPTSDPTDGYSSHSMLLLSWLCPTATSISSNIGENKMYREPNLWRKTLTPIHRRNTVIPGENNQEKKAFRKKRNVVSFSINMAIWVIEAFCALLVRVKKFNVYTLHNLYTFLRLIFCSSF